MRQQTILPLFLFVIILMSPFHHILSQGTDPSVWHDFVTSKNNAIVSDTFKLQTFSNNAIDNWDYRVTGKTSFFYPKQEGISDGSNNKAIKLEAGSTLLMTEYDGTHYSDVFVYASYAAWNLMKGENLSISCDRDGGRVEKQRWLTPTDNYSRSFKQKKQESETKSSFMRIKNEPQNLFLEVDEVSVTKNGFYAIDTICAYGNIQYFSLFSGKGNWHDNSLWTHNAALRRRNALINGEVKIDKYTTCNQIFIGNGSVELKDGQSLHTRGISFMGDDASFYSSGTVETEQISVYRHFTEQGEWYFISLPFDVYADGIDPDFNLGDDTTTGGGNYFYLLTYNGEKRSAEAGHDHYWEVVPKHTGNSQPVIHKNKGYLIAIDEMADKSTLRFTSPKGLIPEDFGERGAISVFSATKQENIKEEDHGWYLCGNPLPSPIALKSFIANSDIDGYAYIYEDGEYKSYSMQSNHIIAPFSAFFVKAKQDTELIVRANNSLRSGEAIFVSKPIKRLSVNPASASVTDNISSPNQTSNSYLAGNTLHLENLVMPGKIMIVDVKGKYIWEKKIHAGSSVIDFPLLSDGFYIVHIQAGSYRAQYKFISSQ